MAFDHAAVRNAAHNHALAVFDHGGALRTAAFGAWALLVGTASLPGLINTLRLAGQRSPRAARRFAAAQIGWLAGWRTHRTERPALTGRGLPPSVNGPRSDCLHGDC
jgi:hypothetical protein